MKNKIKKIKKKKIKECIRRPRGFQGMPSTPNKHRKCACMPQKSPHLQLNCFRGFPYVSKEKRTLPECMFTVPQFLLYDLRCRNRTGLQKKRINPRSSTQPHTTTQCRNINLHPFRQERFFIGFFSNVQVFLYLRKSNKFL